MQTCNTRLRTFAMTYRIHDVSVRLRSSLMYKNKHYGSFQNAVCYKKIISIGDY